MPCSDSAPIQSYAPNSNGPSRRKCFAGSKAGHPHMSATTQPKGTGRHWPNHFQISCPWCRPAESCCRCHGTRQVKASDVVLSQNAWDRPDCTECEACDRLRMARVALEPQGEPEVVVEEQPDPILQWAPGTFRRAFEERAQREAARWVKP